MIQTNISAHIYHGCHLQRSSEPQTQVMDSQTKLLVSPQKAGCGWPAPSSVIPLLYSEKCLGHPSFSEEKKKSDV